MDWIKIILIAVGLLVVLMLGSWLIGIVFSALWYLFWIALIAAGGIVGYKLLTKPETPQIENKEPIAITELKNTDRVLEEYKRKHLSK